MMDCPHCQSAEKFFNPRVAQNEIKAYRKDGPSKATRLLLDTLREAGVKGLSLLDIGGGVGAIQHELVAAGAGQVVDVDASSAYLKIAQSEAQQRGYAENARYIHGDFVQVAPEVEAADIVTLDRVVCCYPDMRALVDLSSQRARRFYGLIYPRDNAFMRIGIRIVNFFSFQLWRNPFRVYIHPTQEVDAIARGNDLSLKLHRYSGVWQVFLYER